MDFSFHSPVKLIFGQAAAVALPLALSQVCVGADQDATVQRVLLISDSGLADIGLVDEMVAVLRHNRQAVTVFTDVQSNPTVRDVVAGLEKARRDDVSALVALGGGSVIDVAKAIGLLMSNGGTYGDYQWRGRPITRPIPPLVALPTTAGTGSEVTKVAVIADAETRFKKGVLSSHMFPRAAIVDPKLTISLPARLTATTGVDALVHALEAFVGARANPLTDTLALAALTRVWRFLPRATQSGDDLEARREMALASTLAGMAFDQSGLGIIHSLAGPLAERYDLHHGLCIGLLLPYGLGFNLPALGEKRDILLQTWQLPTSASDEQVVEQVKTWLRGLALPLTLSELSISDPDLPTLADEASRMVLLPNNPRPVTVIDCQEILEQMV